MSFAKQTLAFVGLMAALATGLQAEELTILKKNIAIPKPVDLVPQKREQYRRVLIPPQERGFDPTNWLALVESPDVTKEDFGRLENLFDARSRLYDASERARRTRSEGTATVEETIAAGYAALNAMDQDGATAVCEKLEAVSLLAFEHCKFTTASH